MNLAEQEIKIHTSITVRVILVVFGVVFVIIGIIGAFLPILPTTPFILLAAGCFARSSTRFYRMLVTNRIFGPAILDWQTYHCISLRTKRFVTVLMVITFTTTVGFFIPNVYGKIAMVLLGCGLLIWIWCIPTCRLEVAKTNTD